MLPLVAAVIRFRKISKQYYLLILLVVCGFINEMLNFFVFKNTAPSSNVYSLAEFLIYAFQFRKWNDILTTNSYFYLLISSAIVFWTVDVLVLDKLNNYNSFFMIGYPFVLILMAVNQLNFLIVNERRNILKSTIFIFCIAIITFYCYKDLAEIFYHYAETSTTKRMIFSIQTYMNVLFNILITIAIVCLPKKRIFIRPLL